MSISRAWCQYPPILSQPHQYSVLKKLFRPGPFRDARLPLWLLILLLIDWRHLPFISVYVYLCFGENCYDIKGPDIVSDAFVTFLHIGHVFCHVSVDDQDFAVLHGYLEETLVSFAACPLSCSLLSCRGCLGYVNVFIIPMTSQDCRSMSLLLSACLALSLSASRSVKAKDKRSCLHHPTSLFSHLRTCWLFDRLSGLARHY